MELSIFTIVIWAVLVFGAGWWFGYRKGVERATGMAIDAAKKYLTVVDDDGNLSKLSDLEEEAKS